MDDLSSNVMNKKSDTQGTGASAPKNFHIHLVSDATGTSLQSLTRGVLAQFENIDPVEWFWPLVRTEKQLARVVENIKEHPGPVLFTFVDNAQRHRFQDACADLGVPNIPVLDPVIKGLSGYLGIPAKGVPGLQHAMDENYFDRIDAIEFALSFDDGQSLEGIDRADVILVGVSRTSKTPTCMFLARRGIRAANIPFTPDVPFPERIKELRRPLIIGLTESPDRLVALRRNRLKADEYGSELSENDYLDLDRVVDEIKTCRRLCSSMGWPVIDVTRRSVEETAAEILILLQRKRKKENGEQDNAESGS